MHLYPYQTKLVADASAAFRKHRSVCLTLPTGAGKTVLAGDISVRMRRDGAGCLYLVHRRELVRQVWDTLHKFGLGDQTGVIAAGHPETPWAPLQIASVQTLVRRLRRISWLRPRMLFIDEAHHIRAKTWEDILAAYPDAYRLLLTATPMRLDGKGLGKHADVLIEGPTIPWLVTNGFLAGMDTFTLPGGISRVGLKDMGGDYSRKDMDERVDGPVIASAIKNINRFARNSRSIFYAISVRHSKAVVAECNFHDIRAEHVDGTTPTAVRDAAMRRFSEGVTQLLSNVNLFSEGIDVPECDCVILGRPTKSLTFYRQANGRAMRRKTDGHKGMLLDLADNVSTHGLPDEEIEWTLDGGAEEQSIKKARRATRICAQCRHVYPSRQLSCPLCGHEHIVRTANEVEIELEEARREERIDKERRGKMMRELNKKVYATMGDKVELRKLQREYGRDPDIVYKWEDIYRPMWNKARRKQEMARHG